MIKESIILAGGSGTRLRDVIGELPKPMADINGKPFLEYLLDYQIEQGIEKIYLSVSYNYQIIQNYFKNKYKTLEIIYSIEDEPLGTGGAIKKAINRSEEHTSELQSHSFISYAVFCLKKKKKKKTAIYYHT